MKCINLKATQSLIELITSYARHGKNSFESIF